MPEKISARKKMKRQESKDLDIKIQFMEGIVRRDPEYIEALQLLGDHYTQRGRYDQSAHPGPDNSDRESLHPRRCLLKKSNVRCHASFAAASS